MAAAPLLRWLGIAACAAAAGGCASFDGRGLVPGRSSEAEVRALMGAPAYERAGAGGERTLYFSRQPYGRQIFAARIDAGGRLLALEQTLTEANVAKLVPGRTQRDEVLALLGPPYGTTWFPRQGREVWEYKLWGLPEPFKVLYAQLSRDGVLREVYLMDDPENRRPTLDN